MVASGVILGLDFGLTLLDAALLDGGRVASTWSLPRPERADPAAVRAALAAGGLGPASLAAAGVTGGRSRELPRELDGLPLVTVLEPEAIGRGGLHLTGAERALVVSCGTGTAIVHADAAGNRFEHVTGSAVGGGTLVGLACHLLGTADPEEVARLAEAGDAGGVDTTLADVLGGGVGRLPPSATAVNFGRLVGPVGGPPPRREDLAAGLVTMVAQVIAVIALNAARAERLERIVLVGRLPRLTPVRTMIEAVWRAYGIEVPPVVPEAGAAATAVGAALAARERA